MLPAPDTVAWVLLLPSTKLEDKLIGKYSDATLLNAVNSDRTKEEMLDPIKIDGKISIY